jgi:hypothetical protein
MPPDDVENLLVLDLRLGDEILMARSERLTASVGGRLLMSWYSETCPSSYVPVFDGVVYVKKATMADRSETASVRVRNDNGVFTWRDYCDAFVLLFPVGVGVMNPEPMPTEAKAFRGRLAVLWVNEHPLREISWSIRHFGRDVDSEVARINEHVRRVKRGNTTPKYDVAFSYASEDKQYVDKVATALQSTGVLFFYDRTEDEAVRLWGKNLYEHLSLVYGKVARHTVMFISKHYAGKLWTSHERQHAQAKAFVENRDCILPVRFDDTEIPGLLPMVSYISTKDVSPEQLADMIRRKVETTRL